MSPFSCNQGESCGECIVPAVGAPLPVCDKGNSYCVTSRIVAVCNATKSGYIESNCESSGKICENGACVNENPQENTGGCGVLGARCCVDLSQRTYCNNSLRASSSSISSCYCHAPAPTATLTKVVPTPTPASQVYCQELCLAKGNSPTECQNYPPCPENIGPINTCTGVKAGGACVKDGYAGTCESEGGECKIVSQSVGKGNTCGTNPYNQKCEENLECINNRCSEPEIVQAGGGERCSTDNQCLSGTCLPSGLCDGPAISQFVTDVPDPLSLKQDPMMAAVLDEEKKDAINNCVNNGRTLLSCQTAINQAFEEGASTGDDCVALYLIQNPSRTTTNAQEQCDIERARAVVTIAAGAGANVIAPLLSSTYMSASTAIANISRALVANTISGSSALTTWAAGSTGATATTILTAQKIISSPATAQTFRTVSTALELGGTGYGLYECSKDPNSDICLSLVAAAELGMIDLRPVERQLESVIAYTKNIGNRTPTTQISSLEALFVGGSPGDVYYSDQFIEPDHIEPMATNSEQKMSLFEKLFGKKTSVGNSVPTTALVGEKVPGLDELGRNAPTYGSPLPANNIPLDTTDRFSVVSIPESLPFIAPSDELAAFQREAQNIAIFNKATNEARLLVNDVKMGYYPIPTTVRNGEEVPLYIEEEVLDGIEKVFENSMQVSLAEQKKIVTGGYNQLPLNIQNEVKLRLRVFWKSVGIN